MTSSFLRDLVADMREHGETHATIQDGGHPVHIQIQVAPQPQPQPDTGRATAMRRLLASGQAQNPALN